MRLLNYERNYEEDYGRKCFDLNFQGEIKKKDAVWIIGYYHIQRRRGTEELRVCVLIYHEERVKRCVLYSISE